MRKYVLLIISLVFILKIAFAKQVLTIPIKNGNLKGVTRYIHKKNIPQTNDSIIYLNDEVDSIMLEKSFNNRCITLIVNTFKDYRKLISFMESKFGVAKYMFYEQSTTDSIYGYGKYRWYHITAFGTKDMELTLKIFEHLGYFEVSFIAWSEVFDELKNDSILIDFFADACKNNLYNEKDIYKIQTKSKHYDKYLEFPEVLNLNYDSLIHCYEKYISLKDDKIEIKLTINQQGKITENEIRANKKLKPILANFIKEIKFPILIYKDSKDTIEYHLSWEFWLSDDTFLKRGLALLKSGKKRYLKSEFRYDNYYITTGDFFKVGKKMALLRNPYGKGVYFYEKIKGEYKELYSANDLENEWFEGMETDDLNADSIDEIIFTTCPNMNGNSWKEVYAYDKKTNKVYNAGNYSTIDSVNKEKKEIYVTYEGSWYMPSLRTVLGWKNGMLLTKKFVELTLKEGDQSEEDEQILEYYENVDFEKGKETLVLKKMKVNSEKDDAFWEGFFN